MRALRGVLVLALAGGCFTVESTSRVERGPLLRSYAQDSTLPGGLEGKVAVDGAVVNFAVTAVQTCRTEQFEEYAEERITERQAKGAGAALASGIAAVLGAGVLAVVSLVVSNAPDVSSIDAAGRYGAAPRQHVQAAAVATGGLGLPALVAGIVGAVQSGVDVVSTKTTQVVSSKERPCNPAGASGLLRLSAANGALLSEQPLDGGTAAVPLAALARPVEAVTLGEQVVQLDQEAQRTLRAATACAQLDARQTGDLSTLGDGQLLRLVESQRGCAPLRRTAPEVTDPSFEAELRRRQLAGHVAAAPTATRATSYDEAVAATAPTLRFAEGSGDLGALDAPEPLSGRAATLRGTIEGALSVNIGVVQVADRQLFLVLPNEPAWSGDFSVGARVEVVGILAGVHTVGPRTLPVLRVVWMRNAF